jgi:hypothetical protein
LQAAGGTPLQHENKCKQRNIAVVGKQDRDNGCNNSNTAT